MVNNANQKILILAETGFIIRNLILGTFPRELDPNIKIIAAVPNPEDPHLRKIVHQDIELIKFHMPPVLDVNKLSRFRRIFNLPHIMYRLEQGYKNSESMKIASKIYDTLDASWYTISVKLLVFLGGLLFKLKLISFIEHIFFWTMSKKPTYQDWLRSLKRHEPDMVVSTTLTLVDLYTASADIPVVLAANQLGIKCGTIVQSWDNLFTKPSVIPKTLTRYWLWSGNMQSQFKKYYPDISQGRLVTIGGLQFDFHNSKNFIIEKNKFFESMNLDPKRPYVVFTTATRRNLPYEDISVVSVIEEILKNNENMQIVIRLHPKDYGARWKKHTDYFKKNKIILQFSSLEISMDAGGVSPPEEFYKVQINTLYYSIAIINTGSTTMVDASILNKPIIYMLWDDKTDGLFPQGRVITFAGSSHLKAIIETGGTSLAKNKKECVEFINMYLENPDTLSEKRKKIVELVTGRADGNAGRRLARDIESLLK